MEAATLIKSSLLETLQCLMSHPVYAALGFMVGFTLLVRFYNKLTRGVCDCNTTLLGKTVIITGANAGIGKETARELAKRGARVIMACRSPLKGPRAVNEIIDSTGNKEVVFKQLDLSSFESVRQFAKNILTTEQRLDILINNAGIFGTKKRKTSADDCELVIQSNHLGHFLLTNLLLELIKKSTPSRIINVASRAYKNGSQNWGDIHSAKKYSQFAAYAKSKMANVLFTRELAKRLDGTGVTVNCLCPGLVKTEIIRFHDSLFSIFVGIFMSLLGKTPSEGAQTTVHLALSQDLGKTTGKYFSECKEEKLIPRALNEESARELWSISERIVGL